MVYGLGFDNTVIIHAKTASTRHVKNADTRLRSVADNFIIAILERLKAKGER
jgi:hypothetical protein